VVQRDDDEAWKSIVDNYGERVEVEPDPPVPDPSTSTGTGTGIEDWSLPAPEPEPAPSWDDAYPDSDWSEDRFVPPPPPPLPRPRRDRLMAWLGVFGSPAVLLFCLVLGIALPELLAYALVAAFVGGFLYLVWLMPRGPRDPDDDGAVI
jgi:hypothetical protein